jgi:hypothetical protein
MKFEHNLKLEQIRIKVLKFILVHITLTRNVDVTFFGLVLSVQYLSTPSVTERLARDIIKRNRELREKNSKSVSFFFIFMYFLFNTA